MSLILSGQTATLHLANLEASARRPGVFVTCKISRLPCNNSGLPCKNSRTHERVATAGSSHILAMLSALRPARLDPKQDVWFLKHCTVYEGTTSAGNSYLVECDVEGCTFGQPKKSNAATATKWPSTKKDRIIMHYSCYHGFGVASCMHPLAHWEQEDPAFHELVSQYAEVAKRKKDDKRASSHLTCITFNKRSQV